MPLICRIYPNGPADVNHFHAAGGMSYFISELISAGLVHTDVTTVAGGDGLLQYGLEPFQNETTGDDSIVYRDGARKSGDVNVLTSCDKPFRPDGGLRLLQGNYDKAVISSLVDVDLYNCSANGEGRLYRRKRIFLKNMTGINPARGGAIIHTKVCSVIYLY